MAKAKKKKRGGLMVGIAAGVFTGLLLAPKSGKETRAELFGEEGFSKQIDRIRDAIGAGRESAGDQNDALRRKINETRERLRAQMSAAEGAADQAIPGDGAAQAVAGEAG